MNSNRILCCLGLMSVSSMVQAQELELFRADKDQNVSVQAFSRKDDERISISKETLVVQAKANSEYAGILISGNWNLSEFASLKLELTGLGNKSVIPILVRLENGNGYFKKEFYAGLLLHKLSVQEGTNEYVVSIPARVPYPDIEKKLQGMQYSPYRVTGIVSCLNPDSVSRIMIYVQRPKQDWTWGIRRIVAVKGNKTEIYPWMNIPEKDFFPFIDVYGQFKHKDWPGKIHAPLDFDRARLREAEDLHQYPGPVDRTRYGGWIKGPRQKALGHFYVKKIQNKWWLVDPEGYLFWSHGVVRVTTTCGITPLDDRKEFFTALPKPTDSLAQFYRTQDDLLKRYYDARGIKQTYDFSGANLYRKYGLNWKKIFAEMVHLRFKSWGLNTLANGSDVSICKMDRTPYADRIELRSPDIEGSSNFHGWWKFKDPFHPEFLTSLRAQLMERKQELDDPWCIGFFVDNEISWGKPTSLAEWVLASPADQPAKAVMCDFLKQKYTTIRGLNQAWGTQFPSWKEFLESKLSLTQIETNKQVSFLADCTVFNAEIIDAYFRNVRQEFKRIAPDKLYLGCRFAGSNELVLRIAAKYCDVISYNIYSRSVAKFELPEGIDKPVMIGEFHFGALDRGLFHPGLIECANQKERAQAYETYVLSALKHPNFIGTHWHQYSDQATTGRFDGENFQVGITDVCDTPYKETIEAIRRVGETLYETRWNSSSDK